QGLRRAAVVPAEPAGLLQEPGGGEQAGGVEEHHQDDLGARPGHHRPDARGPGRIAPPRHRLAIAGLSHVPPSPPARPARILPTPRRAGERRRGVYFPTSRTTSMNRVLPALAALRLAPLLALAMKKPDLDALLEKHTYAGGEARLPYRLLRPQKV